MKRVSAVLFVFLFLFFFTGNLIAAPITLATVYSTVTFDDTSISMDTPDAANLLGYGGASARTVSGSGDYLSWFQRVFFNPPAQPGTVKAQLHITLSDDQSDTCYQAEWAYTYTDGSWFPVLDTYVNGTESYPIDVCLGGDNGVTVTVGSKPWFGGDFFVNKAVLSATYTPAAPVPEPASLLLLGVGLLSAGLFARKKKNN